MATMVKTPGGSHLAASAAWLPQSETCRKLAASEPALYTNLRLSPPLRQEVNWKWWISSGHDTGTRHQCVMHLTYSNKWTHRPPQSTIGHSWFKWLLWHQTWIYLDIWQISCEKLQRKLYNGSVWAVVVKVGTRWHWGHGAPLPLPWPSSGPSKQ